MTDNDVHIISKKKLRDFYTKNAKAEKPLVEWYYKMKVCQAGSLIALRKMFNSTDSVSGYTVFNIAGNDYRLITALHYNRKRCYIRAIWTHAQYSKKENQNKLQRGQL